MDEHDERLRLVEIAQARSEEQLKDVKHDTSNIRLMVTASAAQAATRYDQLASDVKGLSKTLLSIGISLIGTLFTLMVAALVYFITQKMETVDENHRRILAVENKVGP